MKKLIIVKLVESRNDKFDNLLNLMIPIKRARLVYRYFGVICV